MITRIKVRTRSAIPISAIVYAKSASKVTVKTPHLLSRRILLGKGESPKNASLRKMLWKPRVREGVFRSEMGEKKPPAVVWYPSAV
jgi:hypothetical protein